MKVAYILAGFAVLTLAACSKKDTTPKPAADAAPAIATAVTVNGKALNQKVFETYAEAVARRPFAELTPEEREQVRENLARIELFAQDSEKNGLLKDPDVAAQLEVARLQVVQQAVINKLAKEQPPTDAELRAEYENVINNMPLVDYRARHIVVSGEDVALKVIERLKGGADFAAMAKQLSIFKETARQGGELGWFSPTQVDPELGEALAMMKKGEIAARPVRTRMGWNVIQLLDTRDRTAPAFDAVKARIAERVMSNKLIKLSDEMLKTAKVDPPLTTLPAAPAAAPANGAAAPAAAPASTPAEPRPSTPAQTPAPAAN
jgi:peptidyl-prolyl cis-trans isomerase C